MVKNPAANQETQETQGQPLCLEDPLGEEMETHFSVLPGKSREQRSLVDYGPWGCTVSDTTEHAHSRSQ